VRVYLWPHLGPHLFPVQQPGTRMLIWEDKRKREWFRASSESNSDRKSTSLHNCRCTWHMLSRGVCSLQLCFFLLGEVCSNHPRASHFFWTEITHLCRVPPSLSVLKRVETRGGEHNTCETYVRPFPRCVGHMWVLRLSFYCTESWNCLTFFLP